jgi:DNA/RNA endonuclease G (NUC1)
MLRNIIGLGSAFSSGFAYSYYLYQYKDKNVQVCIEEQAVFSKLLRDITVNAESPDLSKTNALVPLGTIGLSKDTSSISRPNRVGEIMRHGYPSLDNLRIFENYILSYDRRNRVANWVFEHLKPVMLKSLEDTDRGKSEFKEDEQIHPYFRSTNQDYKGK